MATKWEKVEKKYIKAQRKRISIVLIFIMEETAIIK